jgi:hypothetical protein
VVRQEVALDCESVSSPEAWQWQMVEGLVEAARVRVEPLLVPLGNRGVGDDTEASGEYVELLARFSGTNRHAGPDAWLPIAARAAELLRTRSKDLRLARMWALASSRVVGAEAVLEGLVLQEALGTRFPNGLHPWSDFDRARSFETFVEGARWDVLGLGEDADLNQLLALGLALDSLVARFGHVFKAPEPGFAPLEDALRTARSRIVPSRKREDHAGDFLRESRRGEAAPPIVTKIEAAVPDTLHAVLRFPDAIELAQRPMKRLAPYRMQLLLRPRVDSIGLLPASIRVADLLAARASSVCFLIEADGGVLRGPGREAGVTFRSEAIGFSAAWETPPLELELSASATDFLGLRVSIWGGERALAQASTRLAVRSD